MSTGLYRKKPVEIEAVQYDGTDESFQEVCEFMGVSGMFRIHDDEGVQIRTLEGTMTASPGDVIIKAVQGEFYSCKPNIFEATYEAV